MERLIFHVDVNSAFLSWEAAKRVEEGLPDLREIPSCIGGDPKLRRSIVVAKSIPANQPWPMRNFCGNTFRRNRGMPPS